MVWTVSKICHFGIAVSCSLCVDVILCSLVCSTGSNVFFCLLILSGSFIWIFYHYLTESNYISKCENFSYFVIPHHPRHVVTRTWTESKSDDPTLPQDDQGEVTTCWRSRVVLNVFGLSDLSVSEGVQ